MTRIKCSVLDRTKEKIFSRIATRGVVKFFNVCNQEQKDIETKVKEIAGSSERKKDKILSSIDKGSFLDRLKENNNLDDEPSEQDKPTWSVLRDDFIMGNKMKDWEKDDEEEEDEDDGQDEGDEDDDDEEEVKIKKEKPKTVIKKAKNIKK